MVIENDVISYYGYLPAIFIYEDPSLNFLDDENRDPEVRIWYHTLESGDRTIKMTMGVSYFYFPFFMIAHQMAETLDYNANGYSLPYRMAISLSSFFFFIWALIFVRKYLLIFFNESTVFWVILIVGVGTNVVNYVVKEAGMNHVFSFFLVSTFLHYLHQWYSRQKLKHLLIVGLTMALLTLVRPINILIIFIFLFYGLNTISRVKERVLFFKKINKEIILAALVGFMVFIPQLLYWKYTTDSWIFYSYMDERFFFNDPKFIDGLFSYRKGWFLYTPLMALSVVGFFIPAKGLNQYKPTLVLFLFIYLYVTFSWWCWWYGGSFGMRALIDIYPLLVLPIAIVIDKLYKFSISIKIISTLVIASLIYLNLFQNYQYWEGMIHYDAMTKETYWMIWGETELMDGYWESLDYTDAEAAKQGKR